VVILTCNRCEDIHLAQKEGKCNNPCKCDCHETILYNDINTTWYSGTAPSFTTTVGSNLTCDTGASYDFNSGVTHESLGFCYSNCPCDYCKELNKKDTPPYPCTCNLAHSDICDYCKESHKKDYKTGKGNP
jgi:hypothetical protein